MNSLIALLERNDKFRINTQKLHQKLKVKTPHHKWVLRRIEEFGFVEGEDYIVEVEEREGRGKRKKDYIITISMAKELCMLEKTDLGRQTRKYFIEVEEDMKKVVTAVPSSELEAIGVKVEKYRKGGQLLSIFKEASLVLGNNEALANSNAVQQTRREIPEADFKELLGQNVDEGGLLTTPTDIGNTCVPTMSSYATNLALQDHGLQVKVGKKWEPTKKALDENLCQWVSVPKSNSDGIPVHQLKWYKEKVVSILMGGEYNPAVHSQQDLFQQERL